MNYSRLNVSLLSYYAILKFRVRFVIQIFWDCIWHRVLCYIIVFILYTFILHMHNLLVFILCTSVFFNSRFLILSFFFLLFIFSCCYIPKGLRRVYHIIFHGGYYNNFNFAIISFNWGMFGCSSSTISDDDQTQWL